MIQYQKGQFITQSGKRLSVTQLLRHAIQLVSFFFFPGLFLTVFQSLRDPIVALATGTFSFASLLPQLVTLAVLLLITALWGRFFCGYLCSFGALQELLAFASRKLLPRKKPLSAAADRVLKYVKYAVLLAIVLGVWVLQLPVDGSLSPWGVFGMLVSGSRSVMSAAIPTVGFAALVAILAASVFIERFFCRYLCPLGAVFTPISSHRLFRIRRAETACSGCGRCSRACAMGVSVHDEAAVKSGECIDCMRCMEVCAPEALQADPNPAVAGTAAALVLCGMLTVGRLLSADAASDLPAAVSTDGSSAHALRSGAYADGVYTGTGTGFRGEISAQVTVENGSITDITVLTCKDDPDYFRRAQTGVVAAILAQQTPQVSAVSGATFSSRGIMEAVADALQLSDVGDAIPAQTLPGGENGSGGQELMLRGRHGGKSTEGFGRDRMSGEGEMPFPGMQRGSFDMQAPERNETPAETEAQPEAPSTGTTYVDGVYTGTGTGYRGQTQVQVMVESGRIADVTVLSYADDSQFFSRAESGVIEAVLNQQSVGVQTVSGATFSSRGILEAIADALDIEYSNSSVSMSRGKR